MNPNTIIYIIAGIAICLFVGMPGALIQLYIYRREKRLQGESPLWSSWSELQSELKHTLHHPDIESAPMDRLLDKLETFTKAGLSEITVEDRGHLTVMLRKIVDDPAQPKGERIRAEAMLLAMPRAEKEQAAAAATSATI